LRAKRGGNNLLELMKQNLKKKIEEGKHKFNVINLLVENKNEILTNLVAEQSFRIAVNSVDPKMHAIKNLFNSMNDQVQSQIKQLKGDITESQS
jgi:heat shock protein HspQ